MADNDLKPYWQDWTFFGLRWVFIFGLSILLIVIRSQENLNFSNQDMAVAFGLASGLNLLLGVLIVFPSLHRTLTYYIVLEDAALALIYVYLSQNDATLTHDSALLIAIVGTLITTALLRLPPVPGTIHALVIIGVSTGVLVYSRDESPLAVLLDEYAIPALVIALLTVTALSWLYVEYQRTADFRDAAKNLSKLRDEQINELRERARAMTEMTTILAGTSDIKTILDAAQDVGRMSVKQTNEKRPSRLISLAMLVRASDEALYLVNSRGLSHINENSVIPGKEGIVARALDDAVTCISKDAVRDPELRTISAFHGIRSVLCIPLRAKYDNFGVLLFGSDKPNAFSEDHIDTLNMIGVQTAVALQNAYLYSTLLEEKERIIQIEEAGRQSLVRDLHDIPAQTIAAVKMRINIIQRLMEKNPAQVPAELKEVEELAQRANEEIRHILSSLNPLALENQGLRAALEQFAERVRKPPINQRIQLRVASDVETYLDKTKQGAIYYLIEEAVGNACKYAEADMIQVVVARESSTMFVQIKDNGKGFDPNKRKNDGRDHFGMVNMQQRADTLDGTLDLTSEIGKGTRITVRFPIEAVQQGMEFIADTKLARRAMDDFERMIARS